MELDRKKVNCMLTFRTHLATQVGMYRVKKKQSIFILQTPLQLSSVLFFRTIDTMLCRPIDQTLLQNH